MRYAEMNDAQAKAAIDECIRQVIGEFWRSRAENGARIDEVKELHLMLRRRLSITEDVIALFIHPTPTFGRLPDVFKIDVMANTPNDTGETLRWEILSTEMLTN